ncbi:MAG: putative metal-binding motif-containing protein [Proteobacteria bacterium]|nr:putative metal-binding motif-containing protein [Pseudomonadota bacterium]
MRSALLLSAVALAGCTGEAGITIYNVAPSVSITDPVDSAMFEEGETLTFRGVIADDGPLDDLTFRWASSLDGELASLDIPDAEGNIELTTANLSPGVHVVELQAVDGDGLDGSDNVTITIDEVPELPSIRVEHPAVGEQGVMGQPFVLLVNVSDAQDPPDQLVVEASSSPTPGFVCYMVPGGTGDAQCTASWADAGSYLLTFTVTDTDQNTSTANATLQIVDPLDFDGDNDGYTPNGGDCNDSNATMYPGAPEICDNLDNDCNPNTLIDVGTDCFDDDGDGQCEAPPCANTSSGLADCNDADATIYNNPNVQEQINGTDDDCDTRIDEDTSVYDDDGDGFCESGNCINASGTQPDCNDNAAPVNPDANEDCSTSYDDNCDGLTNTQNAVGCQHFYLDQDGDTYGVRGGTECYCDTGVQPYTGTNSNDCYDNNANARPGQGSWFSVNRGDGSFDYNCDNAQEKRYNGSYSPCFAEFAPFTCETNSAGWTSSNPQCGSSASWVDSCDNSYDAFCMGVCILTETYASCTNCYTCGENYETQQQTCR